MIKYCVNKFGDNEVHKVEYCSFLPVRANRVDFNAYSDTEAMRTARELYREADGCFYCMGADHRG